MTQKQLASFIAYTLRDREFSYEDRMRIANAAADELALRGTRRETFIDYCHTYGELTSMSHSERHPSA